jgi:PAS domain S-box-containing protein
MGVPTNVRSPGARVRAVCRTVLPVVGVIAVLVGILYLVAPPLHPGPPYATTAFVVAAMFGVLAIANEQVPDRLAPFVLLCGALNAQAFALAFLAISDEPRQTVILVTSLLGACACLVSMPSAIFTVIFGLTGWLICAWNWPFIEFGHWALNLFATAAIAIAITAARVRSVNAEGHATARLVESEGRLRHVLENLPAGTVMVDGEHVSMNAGAETITGYRRDELTTLDQWFRALYGDEHIEVRQRWADAHATGLTGTAILPIRRKDGTRWLVEFAACAWPGGEVWLLQDRTERAAAEERFRALFELSADAHLIADETGVVDCNGSTVAMLGAAHKHDVIGRNLLELSAEHQPSGPSAELLPEMVALAHEHGSHRFEWMARATDGEVFPVEATLTPVTLSERSALIVIASDIAERKFAEEQLQRSYVEVEEARRRAEEHAKQLAQQAD